MALPEILFYVFGAVLLGAATMTISSRNPVRAALSLVLTFVAAAGLWLLLEAEFLAMVLVLVYVGAVMVLFLFVVMMLDIDVARMREGFVRMLPLGALMGVLLVVEIAWALGSLDDTSRVVIPGEATLGNTRVLGDLIYTKFLWPFEIAGLVLLVAIVAAIALSHRGPKTSRYQNPASQISVRRDDRMRVLRMPPERPLASEGSAEERK